jgi:hypothetical protein
VAARSKGCGHSLPGIAGSNVAGGRGHICLSVVSLMCCQVKVSATSWSLVQRSPTECGVPECHREASIMGKPGLLGAVAPLKRKISGEDCLSGSCDIVRNLMIVRRLYFVK